MALFIGIHKLQDATQEKVDASWSSYKAACQEMNLKAHKVHYNVGKEVGYCYTEAASEAEVLKAHENAKVSVEEVIEIQTAE